MITNKELAELAVKAKSKSIAPYSNFHVGAALQAKDGKVILGANIENASYGLTMCAERTAVFSALLDGKREFVSIAIAGDSEQYLPPCGACRQILMEFCGKDLDVIMVNNNGAYITLKMFELLPHSFDEEFLK
ncbi:MAG: Cytidine deaminase [Ignavibacteria bacterium]|nr:MAG: Cytidine deaminase [Ignavibacteria bacterium]KAF0160329.1 MAG: Cytidine deaminase [Ignavibacteria bacterium]